MSITIRKALLEDAYNYTDCFIACLQTAYKGIVSDDFLNNLSVEKEQRAEKFRKSLTNPEIDVYCVTFEKEMIGFLTTHKIDSEIWSIYLLEEFRGKGHGKVMLDFALESLQHIGHKKITLWVFEENIRARRFYENNGLIFDGMKRDTTNYGKPLIQLRYTQILD